MANITGAGGNDLRVGTADDDTITGGAGNDLLEGLDGSDTIIGGSGNDNLIGSAGEDSVSGGVGNDLISGGEDDDTITGATGSDILAGGAGVDELTGGAGADNFQFNFPDEGVDTIKDFVPGTDKISIVQEGFTAGLALGPLPAGKFTVGAPTPATRFIYNNANGSLSFDPDGNGPDSSQQIATLTGAPTIAAADIVVI